VAKAGTSNQDRTISLKAAVRSCINKQIHILQKVLKVRNFEFTHMAYKFNKNPSIV